jgi:nitroreductase
MNTLEAITERRSIKHYDPSHQITDEEIKKLLSYAVLSPTSFNIQNWRIVVSRNEQTRKKLRAASWDQAQVTESSAVLILCADIKAWEKNPKRYWKDAPEAVGKALIPMIAYVYEGRDQLQRDEAIRSCGIVAQTIMLTAKEMGYDSCPMIGFDPVIVAEIINLPEDHLIGLMITIGKPLKPAQPRGGQLPLSEVVFNERFRSKRTKSK